MKQQEIASQMQMVNQGNNGTFGEVLSTRLVSHSDPLDFSYADYN